MRHLTRQQLTVDLVGAGVFGLVCFPWAWIYGETLQLPVLMLFVAALALRRLVPGASLGIAWLAAFVQMFARESATVFDFAAAGVLYATAAYGDRVVRWLGFASAFVGAFIATGYLVFVVRMFQVWEFTHPSIRDISYTVVLFVAILAVLLLSWVTGTLVRTARVGRETRRREEAANRERELADYQVVVEQERNRIARDMHDVVAHSLAVVIAQADGARFAAARKPSVAKGALETISEVARGALGDVRMLLAELRHDEGSTPQPRLADLGEVVEQVRGAGLQVDFSETGARMPLGAGHEIAAYRIVQEALTNALRHGDTAKPVALALLWDAEGVWIDVVNAVRPEAGAAGEASGQRHGIPGMRERAQLAGGVFSADAPGDGTFHVRARIPRAA